MIVCDWGGTFPTWKSMLLVITNKNRTQDTLRNICRTLFLLYLLCILHVWATGLTKFAVARTIFSKMTKKNISTYSFRSGAWLQLFVKSLNAYKLLIQGHRYHKLRKAFSKFYRRHIGLVEKYNASLKKLRHQGISEPEFYGDLAVGKFNCSGKFRKPILAIKEEDIT